MECGLGLFFSFLECGFIFHILECGKVFVVVFSLSFWFSFFGDPPGTHAPRSAVTRGKPSLFWFFFSSLPGLFESAFCFVLVLHLVRLWCVPFWFLVWFETFLVCFLLCGCLLSSF